MTTSPPQPSSRVALLDTTIQVDRMKTGVRARQIESVLKTFDLKVTTSIALLEFKATVIQECVFLHNLLRRVGRLSAVQDLIVERKYRQTSLRTHILHNWVNVHASSFATPEDEDSRLARKARQNLENIIPRLYDWFIRSVDEVLRDPINCTRADERPVKKRVAFETNLPVCRRGQNKFCSIEEFIRQNGAGLGAGLRAHLGKTADQEGSTQLVRACELFESVQQDPKCELSNGDCRRGGDCLIALEAEGHATHALSTNAREWDTLSKLMGFEFVRVDYPEEKTR